MAQILEYDGQGAGTTNNASESFEPKSSFILLAIGTFDSNVEFHIEWLPDNLADNTNPWYTPGGTNQQITAGMPSQINYAKGFKYRVARKGTGTQSTAVSFYWGNGSTVQWTFA